MLASLAQAGLYGLEGNSALAAHYLSQSLMIGLAGPVGGAVLGALSKMGPAAKAILGTVLGAQSLYTAGVAGINLYNSASKIADGLLNGDMSWLDAFCEGSMALNSAAGIYYSLKGLVNSCELTLKGLDDVATKYAAKQEAWYRNHAGYTTDNLGNIQESGASVMPQSVAKNRNIMVYVSKNVGKGGSDVIPESLLQGEADTRVYYGIKDGKKDYVGITNDIARRQAQHGDRFDRLIEITDEPLTRRQARAIEQVLIEDNPQFSNKINSISSKRDWYDDATDWARKWLNEHKH